MLPFQFPSVLIVPGLRNHVADHWQTHLEHTLRGAGRRVVCVPPMGRLDLDCSARINAIERTALALDTPFVMVAHSGGCIMVAHWAMQSRAVDRVAAALLATPPDFEQPMPDGYPTLAELNAAGWLPVPRQRLPFSSVVLASQNDPLTTYDRVAALSLDWGCELVNLGSVGHLNPASGFGPWPEALSFINRLTAANASVSNTASKA